MRDTNAVELFVDNASKGEVEYVFANRDGNTNVDVSQEFINLIMILHAIY